MTCEDVLSTVQNELFRGSCIQCPSAPVPVALHKGRLRHFWQCPAGLFSENLVAMSVMDVLTRAEAMCNKCVARQHQGIALKFTLRDSYLVVGLSHGVCLCII